MNETSTNGYPVLFTNESANPNAPLPRIRRFIIPGVNRHFFIRDGSAGFLLAHLGLWFHERIEPLDTNEWDDWGWAVRPVRGQTTGFSNHSSATALDLNATEHPMGVPVDRTFTPREIRAIKRRVLLYRGCVVWGGEWRRPDGMHFEIGKPLEDCEKRATQLLSTPRGVRILDANPGLRKVILT